MIITIGVLKRKVLNSVLCFNKLKTISILTSVFKNTERERIDKEVSLYACLSLGYFFFLSCWSIPVPLSTSVEVSVPVNYLSLLNAILKKTYKLSEWHCNFNQYAFLPQRKLFLKTSASFLGSLRS